MIDIRPATPADVPAVAALAALTFPLACPPDVTAESVAAFIADNLTEAHFERSLADTAREVLVALAAGEIVGYTLLVAGEPTDADVAAAVRIRPAVEISKCYVHPDHHGAGTAGGLMQASIEVARTRGAAGVWLGVNQQNVRAQRFYGKQGFAKVGTKRFRVGDRMHDDFVFERAV